MLMLMLMACLEVVMTATIDLLLLVTLTLTLVSTPSHETPHRTQYQTLSQLLDDAEDLQLTATVGKPAIEILYPINISPAYISVFRCKVKVK